MSNKTGISPAQLRSMLYKAYKEGFKDRQDTAGKRDSSECWNTSHTKRVLIPHAKRIFTGEDDNCDLFGRVDSLPPAIQSICEKYAYIEDDFRESEFFKSELNIHGFTIDINADGSPANLRTTVKNADLTVGDPVIANDETGTIKKVYIEPTSDEVGSYEVRLSSGTICISGHFIERTK